MEAKRGAAGGWDPELDAGSGSRTAGSGADVGAGAGAGAEAGAGAPKAVDPGAFWATSLKQ